MLPILIIAKASRRSVSTGCRYSTDRDCKEPKHIDIATIPVSRVSALELQRGIITNKCSVASNNSEDQSQDLRNSVDRYFTEYHLGFRIAL